MSITYSPAHVLPHQPLHVLVLVTILSVMLFCTTPECDYVTKVKAGLDSILKDVPASKIHHHYQQQKNPNIYFTYCRCVHTGNTRPVR